MILTFYDIETSGLDTEHDDILQIAYASVDTVRNKVMRANSLYLWEDDYAFGQDAYNVHKIGRSFLESLPREEMAKKYQEIFAVFNRAFVMGYNNIRFDDRFLQSFMRRRAQPIVFDGTQDVMAVARNYFGGNPGKLSDLPSKIGISPILIQSRQETLFGNYTQAHDATYDIAATVTCLEIILARRGWHVQTEF